MSIVSGGVRQTDPETMWQNSSYPPNIRLIVVRLQGSSLRLYSRISELRYSSRDSIKARRRLIEVLMPRAPEIVRALSRRLLGSIGSSNLKLRIANCKKAL